MRRVLILVEGQTEETFVRDILNPHLVGLGLCLVPTLVVTKFVKDGPNFKGGIASWKKVSGDLVRLLGDTSAVAVTTMLDYYGLPADFPGMDSRPREPAEARVSHLEAAMSLAIAEDRFIPYLSLHEFEALVFASLDDAGWVFDENPKVLLSLRRQLTSVATAEDLNERAATAPSRRIAEAFPQYQKVLHGPMAVEASGLETLRESCPHFGAWLSRLEGL